MSYRDDPELMARLYESFRATPLHALLGIDYVEGDQPDGTVVVSMPVRPEAYGASGNLHGGAIATLIDVAAATAAARESAFVPGVNTLVTADLHVRYLGRPTGDMVYARAHVVRAGRQLIVVECRVVDGEDRVIAVADFSSMVVPLREPLPGAAHDPASPEL
ncbi:PaaI family thioesterase [Rhabdothermincola sediminis]|uniref:PaaI family thioesterase n=1 Tax=Rhabdothermincola sediminis TaxID=2751370 RepID=UPI001AA02EC8|nr:PaaI family thioesterase [Rhabdothermincola sediminis]